MTSPLDLAYRTVGLDADARRHLERLMATWSLLADLSFSDLLLYVPLAGGREEDGDERLVVLGQVRPTTNQTLFEIDLVGETVAGDELPLVVEALRTGAIAVGEQRSDSGHHLRLECTPVAVVGRVVGVMTRVWSPAIARRPGSLERVYLELFERLAIMVSDGVFPFPGDDPVEHLPRVGDGVLVLDDSGRVVYGSPNAVSALHRVGIMSAVTGSTLQALGLDTTVVEDSFAERHTVVEEIERRSEVTLLLRCIPLLERGSPTGALILLRDLTEVRNRDRLLVTKDATIREVHHRVKNNLQTISSLLRLQGRRIDVPAAKTALAEAERRIGTIAVVHEILSHDARDQVPFDDIVEVLVRMAKESSVSSREVDVVVEGALGDVPADMATPLAVVIAELLQNAVEHAFVEGGDDFQPEIELSFSEDHSGYCAAVRDNGCGLPPGFDLETTRSLGMSIVRDLVRTQLGGTIEMITDGGTLVRLEVPARSRRSQS